MESVCSEHTSLFFLFFFGTLRSSRADVLAVPGINTSSTSSVSFFSFLCFFFFELLWSASETVSRCCEGEELSPSSVLFFFFFFLLAEGASWVSASIGSASGLRAGQVGEVDREVWVDGGVGSMPTLGSSVQSARDTTDYADEGYWEERES